jgi:glycosyltransferase involved in cell wall biosynthesis
MNPAAPVGTSVDIVVPVFNVVDTLEQRVGELQRFFAAHLSPTWKLLLADHASSDGTFWVARKLADSSQRVKAIQVARPGRSGALLRALKESDGSVFCHLDLDPEVTLEKFPAAVNSVVSGEADLAIVATDRDLPSRLARWALNTAFQIPICEGQRAYAAMRRQVALGILPQLESASWFLDTELAMLAQAAGYRVSRSFLPPNGKHGGQRDTAPTLQEQVQAALRLRRRLRRE